MNSYPTIRFRSARGFVLIASLLLLLVMTLLALAMFHSFGIQELVAGNVREKQRALQSAFAAEQYAELWLTYPGNALTKLVDCSALTLQPYTPGVSVPYICKQSLASLTTVTSVPWKNVNNTELGFAFYPGSTAGSGDLTVSTTGGLSTYYQVPRFYISLQSYTPATTTFRIEAWNWGGTPNTSAVIEATYVVTNGTQSASGT
jgi:type IV pilus assembly protein PilX